MLAGRLATEVVRLFEAICPAPEHLRPGQLLWTVPDRNTSPRSHNRPLIPVILTLSSPEDAQRLAQGATISENLQEALSRMFLEAHAQGGLLSVRDAALVLHHHQSAITRFRQSYEKRHDCILPHPGSLQDVGSTVSHKAQAVRKVVFERKDPATVAREITHSQSSVDRYLRDYHRVKTLYDVRPDPTFIHQCTNIAKHVVRQYVELIEQEKKRDEQKSEKPI
jgi:alkanesulfonate monooxygenase SsuD/methylene tetrahydromethanopterin reductase-like flavin-dependent oxidoreductase (luciferase family)